MARFRIAWTRSPRPVASLPSAVEAENWMEALALAVGAVDDGGTSSRVVCDLMPSGAVVASDPVSGMEIIVSELREGSSSTSLLPDDLADAPDAGAAALAARDDQGELEMERVFDALASVAAAPSIGAACHTALDILLREIPAESASILVHQPVRDRLVFSAVRGPRAEALEGTSIPAHAGIAGLALRSGATLLVRNASSDPKHYGAIDRHFHYQTRELLAVPLHGTTGVRGVLELLNPFGGVSFAAWHEDAARAVAAQLAERLNTL